MVIYSIYKATNKITGKCYIGFTSNWSKRYTSHKNSFIRNDNKFYQNIREYGWDNFQWEIIYQSWDYNYCLNEMESHFIGVYNSFIDGLNSTSGGGSTYTLTDDSRDKMRLQLEKRWSETNFGPEITKKIKDIWNDTNSVFHSEEYKTKKANGLSDDWLITTPTGETMVIKNLCKFCRDNGLSSTHMVKVSKGKNNHHKGYKCVNLSKGL